MQKLKFVNANGVELDLTSGHYGITKWNGFSNANLNLQTQQVPYQDGSVFIDGLLNNRELSVTLCINDNNDLEKRYELRNELIRILNPKLGEGYLYYKNDYLERRIKVIPQLPVIDNKNSNESGTVKASLSWTACGVYWEDVDETTVTLKSFEEVTVNNEGDVPCPVKIEADTWNIPAYSIKNNNQKIRLENIQDINKVYIKTFQGEKEITGIKTPWKIGININSLECISSNNNISCAVGASGAILTSADGETWVSQISGVTTALNGVTYSESLGIFCAVGASGVILTSADGETWVSQISGVTTALNGVTYSEALGIFCAVGASGVILTSADGVTWTQRTSGVTIDLRNATFILNKIYVVGSLSGGSSIILTSTDGVIWENLNPGEYSTNSIAFREKDNLFVLAGNLGLLTSSDGETWTRLATYNLSSIIYISELDIFIGVGRNSSLSGSLIVVSSDGINWISQELDSNYFNNVHFNKSSGLIEIVGTSSVIYTSYNYNLWHRKYGGVYGSLRSITYNQDLNLFYSGAFRSIFVSPDGITWYLKTDELNISIYDIIYCEALNLLVAVGMIYTGGSNGYISISSDGGNTWTNITTISTSVLYSITYSESLGIFCAVSASGAILTSADGETWVSQTSGVTTGLYGIAFNKSLGIFCAVGASGVILTSADGETWVSQTSGVTTALNGVTYSEALGIFCAVGDNISLYSEKNINQNIISHLSSDSDMTFSLQPGENNLLVYNTQRVFNSKLTYRQRYVGL